MNLVVAVLVTGAMLCLVILAGAVLVLSVAGAIIEGQWWLPFATSPWWAFGLTVAVFLTREVWSDV